MREKIADIDIYKTLLRENFGQKKLGNFYADQILTLIREKIEKVENPYMEQTRDGECNIYPDFGIFDEARQAILKALEAE